MISDVDKVVMNILSMPILFKTKSQSPSSLLIDSGYLGSLEAITVGAIVDALQKFPEYVEIWLAWSNDKRTDSGWYFKRNNSESYIVGYYPAGKKFASTKYTDAYIAAANFIKREIEDIRESIL